MIGRSATLMAGAIALCGANATTPASAAPGPHLDWGQQLTASETSCPSGDKILNVNYRIMNSLDGGGGTNDFGGNAWAFIDYVLHLQVVELESGEFCATAKTQGSFESIGGDGPSGEGDLADGVIGTFQGGYTDTFSGTFDPGDLRTRGSIGTFDHQCDETGLCTGFTGSAVFRWRELYFPGAAHPLEWWGWIYRAGNNGVWVNASDGNDGNITGD